jgi:hypothetical protein
LRNKENKTYIMNFVIWKRAALKRIVLAPDNLHTVNNARRKCFATFWQFSNFATTVPSTLLLFQLSVNFFLEVGEKLYFPGRPQLRVLLLRL